jgi:hypothetical protein
MPSINRYVEIHGERRIRLNTCEGHVGITEEVRDGGMWTTAAQININREQAERLIAQLTDQMAKHY